MQIQSLGLNSSSHAGNLLRGSSKCAWWMDAKMDRWVNGEMDGWMERWMNGEMDGWRYK